MNDDGTHPDPNGNPLRREPSKPRKAAAPDSVMPSLVALNTWLLAWEDGPHHEDRRDRDERA